MTGRSHLLLAAGAYVALALHPVATPLATLAVPRLAAGALDVPGVELVVGAVVAAAAGLAPDADSAGSRAARAGGLPTRMAAGLFQRVLGHRGPLHSLAAAALAWWVGLVLGLALGVDGLAGVVAFGWCVHLLLDALTPRGVPLLAAAPSGQHPPRPRDRGHRRAGRGAGRAAALRLVDRREMKMARPRG